MGIGDLFSIFAGGAWLATETAKEIGERAVGEERSRFSFDDVQIVIHRRV